MLYYNATHDKKFKIEDDTHTYTRTIYQDLLRSAANCFSYLSKVEVKFPLEGESRVTISVSSMYKSGRPL